MRIGKVRQGEFSDRAFGRRGIILYTSGDNSIKAAMENGGIKKIHHVDFDVTNVFNLYSKVTTIVYGE